jgi:hypothetical protein
MEYIPLRGLLEWRWNTPHCSRDTVKFARLQFGDNGDGIHPHCSRDTTAEMMRDQVER